MQQAGQWPRELVRGKRFIRFLHHFTCMCLQQLRMLFALVF